MTDGEPSAGGTAGGTPARALAWLASPYLLLVLNMLVWSGNWIAGRAVREHLAPLELAFWRWFFAFALLAPFTARRLWAHRAVLRRDWRILLVLGVVGIAMFNTLIYTALQYTTAINGALITAAQPVGIVAVSWLVFRDGISARQALGIAVSLVGVLAIVTRGDPALLAQVRFNVGDLWALAIVPTWAVYSVLLRKRPPELDPFALLTAIIGIGVLCLAPLQLVAGGRGLAALGDPRALAAIAYVSVFASVLGYVLWNTAVARIGPNTAGQFIYLVPAFTAGLAFVLLGERLHLYHWVGVALIFTGIRLTTRQQARTAARTAAARTEG